MLCLVGSLACGGCVGGRLLPGMFALPVGFPGLPGAGRCQAIPAASGRKFGPFQEKTLVCDRVARQVIDELCWQGGFTQAWEEGTDFEEKFTMTKIPAIILVKLMLGLGSDQEEVAESLVGAYPICMDPHGEPPRTWAHSPTNRNRACFDLTSLPWALAVRTCMNVIVGRRPDGRGGFVLDKFSLYYPNNSAISGDNWDLLQGYSFRTAALSGSLNRAGLHNLRSGSVPVAEGIPGFDAKKHGLVIDDESAYEDCAYVDTREGETNADRQQRIDGLVNTMVAAYGSQGILSLSYDPAERQQGTTVLESEWTLLKRVVAEERAAAEAVATQPSLVQAPVPEPHLEPTGIHAGLVMDSEPSAEPLAPDAVRSRLGLLSQDQTWRVDGDAGSTDESTNRRGRLLLPVIHVQTGIPGFDHVGHVVGEAKTCFDNGADGVLLCAWHLPPQVATLAEVAGPDEVATPTEVNDCFAAVRASHPTALIGVNYLRDLTCIELLPSDADILWTDYGAGTDRSSTEHARCVRERVALQKCLDADPLWKRPVHFGAFAFPKIGVTPPSDAELPCAAAMAQALLEVPTSSGPSTGVPIDAKRAAQLRGAIGEEGCLAIASGVSEQNCRALLPHFDIFIVNSSLLMTQAQKQGRHFLPWTCPQCTVVEENYPTMCDCCDFNRQDHPSYAAAVAAASDPTAKALDALDRIHGQKVRRLADLVHGPTWPEVLPDSGA